MDVREYIQEHAPEFFATLSEWLTIPSVSADPDRYGDVGHSAEWLRSYLLETGFPTAEVWPTGVPGAAGLPAVFAEWPAADPQAPVVLIYGHHDVQPVEPLEEWESPPFEPVQRGDLLLGRGSSDDKGQVLFHTLGIRAGLAASGAAAPPVTLKLLIEGEEESGSPHFAELLRAHRDRLRCDVIVVSDTTMWAADVPSMCVGMRGVISAEISMSGPERDLHSGSFGGAVPNPLHVLADMLAGLHDVDRARAHRPPSIRREGVACRCRPQRRDSRRGGVRHAGASVGTADRRGKRHVGRAHRGGRQDHRAGPRARQAVLPAGRQPGARRRRRGTAAVCARAHTARHRGHGRV
jgi:acetylornithine deacetylase/succinyl-diaminopimelate desuccinylase-like protein